MSGLSETDEVADEWRIRPVTALVGGNAGEVEERIELALVEPVSGRIVADPDPDREPLRGSP
jgi:hypothetical protein